MTMAPTAPEAAKILDYARRKKGDVTALTGAAGRVYAEFSVASGKKPASAATVAVRDEPLCANAWHTAKRMTFRFVRSGAADPVAVDVFVLPIICSDFGLRRDNDMVGTDARHNFIGTHYRRLRTGLPS